MASFTPIDLPKKDAETINQFLGNTFSKSFLDIIAEDTDLKISDAIQQIDKSYQGTKSENKKLSELVNYSYQFALARDMRSRFACRNAIYALAYDRKLYYDNILQIAGNILNQQS